MIGRSTRIVVAVLLLSAVAATSAWAEELPRRGLMGIMISPINDEMKDQLGLPSTDGVLITSTRPESPAAKAKLQSNDVVVKVGSSACTSIPDLQGAMRDYYAGDTVKLTVLREGKEVTADLNLMERPREESEQYDILYDSIGTTGRRARTIITKPKSGAKSPAILFIQGLSPQTVEVGLFPQHPYKSLIGQLDEAGFVTMRVERLGVGDSEGTDPNATTVKDDVRCFREALAKLGTYDFVDPKRVFVFSHSSGGAIAPMVAAGGNVRGVITWASIANPVSSVVPALVKTRWELEVREDEEIEQNTRHMKTFIKLCLIQGQSPTDVFTSHPEVEEVIRPFMQGDDIVMGAHYRYWQQVAALDLPREWTKVDANVLALWGTSDYNSSRACSELIAKTVNKAHPGNGTFKALPRVDHTWQPAEDQEESFLAGPSGEFSPTVIETITVWTKKVS